MITITVKNSSKVKMLLRRDILNQKSASVSGSFSHASARGGDKSDSPPSDTVRSHSVDSSYRVKPVSVRIRRKKVKRIDVFSSSPVRPRESKRLATHGESSSDSDLGTIGAITWGSPIKVMKHGESEYLNDHVLPVDTIMLRMRSNRFRK